VKLGTQLLVNEAISGVSPDWNLRMLSIVVSAMFNKVSRVKKAWWPAMITFGKVSSLANTSSLRINPERVHNTPASPRQSCRFQFGRRSRKRLLRLLPRVTSVRVNARFLRSASMVFSARGLRCLRTGSDLPVNIDSSISGFAGERGVDQPARDRPIEVTPHRRERVQWIELVAYARPSALLLPQQAIS
jgi:hypothetical protein